uniref:(northern house mosquito) hypothetical protein n=1 Tax=Culex pipiens TaxID=7175 RepID=A0A8D8L6L4_CULPI
MWQDLERVRRCQRHELQRARVERQQSSKGQDHPAGTPRGHPKSPGSAQGSRLRRGHLQEGNRPQRKQIQTPQGLNRFGTLVQEALAHPDRGRRHRVRPGRRLRRGHQPAHLDLQTTHRTDHNRPQLRPPGPLHLQQRNPLRRPRNRPRRQTPLDPRDRRKGPHRPVRPGPTLRPQPQRSPQNTERTPILHPKWRRSRPPPNPTPHDRTRSPPPRVLHNANLRRSRRNLQPVGTRPKQPNLNPPPPIALPPVRPQPKPTPAAHPSPPKPGQPLVQHGTGAANRATNSEDRHSEAKKGVRKPAEAAVGPAGRVAVLLRECVGGQFDSAGCEGG